jgi:hypothetical protein
VDPEDAIPEPEGGGCGDPPEGAEETEDDEES